MILSHSFKIESENLRIDDGVSPAQELVEVDSPFIGLKIDHNRLLATVVCPVAKGALVVCELASKRRLESRALPTGRLNSDDLSAKLNQRHARKVPTIVS